MYALTGFKNRYDNKTHKVFQFDTLPEFETFLERLSRVRQTKETASLITPAIYKPGTTRANANVDHWAGWAALDVDDLKVEGDLIEFLDRTIPVRFLCYSTASSTVEHPKFRLVFPLLTHVPASDLQHFWYALNKELGEMGDPQTKDMARMFYIPAKYKGAHNFFHVKDTDLILDPKKLMKFHPYVKRSNTGSFLDHLPEEVQKMVLDNRKSKMTNTNIRWNDYRDCPFFPKSLGLKYQSITDAGWYHTMYCIMVAIASNAIKAGYPITENEIESLCRQFDIDNGNWYSKRKMNVEAARAISYAYRNTIASL